MIGMISNLINPLTTDDAFGDCLTLAACYQFAKSILKIGFVLKMWDRRSLNGSTIPVQAS